MNKLYKDLMTSSISKALADMRASASYDNEQLKGRAREVFITNLLRPYLNPAMDVCTGMVTDSDGRHSHQIDIIIFDKEIVPPFLLTEGEAIVPIESVLATIEVKSLLNSTEIHKAVANARSVKLLSPFFAEIKKADAVKKSPICYLFAYESDLVSKSEHTRLQEAVNAQNEEGPEVLVPISAICVAGKSFTICVEPVKNTRFEVTTETADTSVVLHFLVSVIDMCNFIALQRGRIFVRKYFLDEPDE